jgi:hypothetical protein
MFCKSTFHCNKAKSFYGLGFNSLGRHYVYEWIFLIDYFLTWRFKIVVGANTRYTNDLLYFLNLLWALVSTFSKWLVCHVCPLLCPMFDIVLLARSWSNHVCYDRWFVQIVVEGLWTFITPLSFFKLFFNFWFWFCFVCVCVCVC